MTHGSSTEPRSIAAARARALRAARAVTLGLVLASAGCAASVSPPDDVASQPTSDATPRPADARVPIADAAPPTAEDAAPLPVADAEVADAAGCGGLSGDEWFACCEANGWDWQRGCAAWGPLVPPAMDPMDVTHGASTEAA